jgi:UDP-N-acetylglucosamine acyltransferase
MGMPVSRIDARAVIDENARLGDGVIVGPFAVIGPGVTIGDGTKIGPAAFIEKDTTIGKDCFVAHGAVVGSDPQDLKYNGERTLLTIGDRTTIREFATVNRAAGAGEATTIGNDVLIMAYVHIAHNCIIGDNVVIVNAVSLAGHVEVGECAIIGGVTPVHQFVRIGKYSFVGGASRISKDVPPYFKVAGIPTRPIEVNTVGLQRHGFSEEALSQLRQCYRLLYLSDLNTTQALSRIRAEMPTSEETKTLVAFVESSSRGILK